MMFYLIMRDGDPRRWWNEDGWGTRPAAHRYSSNEYRIALLPHGGRWVGPCDGTEE